MAKEQDASTAATTAAASQANTGTKPEDTPGGQLSAEPGANKDERQQMMHDTMKMMPYEIQTVNMGMVIA